MSGPEHERCYIRPSRFDVNTRAIRPLSATIQPIVTWANNTWQAMAEIQTKSLLERLLCRSRWRAKTRPNSSARSGSYLMCAGKDVAPTAGEVAAGVSDRKSRGKSSAASFRTSFGHFTFYSVAVLLSQIILHLIPLFLERFKFLHFFPSLLSSSSIPFPFFFPEKKKDSYPPQGGGWSGLVGLGILRGMHFMLRFTERERRVLDIHVVLFSTLVHRPLVCPYHYSIYPFLLTMFPMYHLEERRKTLLVRQTSVRMNLWQSLSQVSFH